MFLKGKFYLLDGCKEKNKPTNLHKTDEGRVALLGTDLNFKKCEAKNLTSSTES